LNTTDLKRRRDKLLGEGAALFYDEPISIVKGEGVWLFDDQGKRYLDMYNNVPCVGHANPHVVDAMQKQASTLNVHSRYLNPGALDFAERLLNLHHESITSVVFSCTGTEANEVALMMARCATGGRGIICSDSAYHGNSTEVRKLTSTKFRETEPGSDIRGFPYPQKYRPLQEGLTDGELCELYLTEVSRVIQSFKADNIPFAGMIVCSLFANEGLPDIPAGFMAKAAALVHEAGGLVIADEVQAGYCRTGSWWGYEVSDFIPDIVTMGKPMGNGMPIAATAASSELVDTFRKETRYFNTFASSPLQAAVGSAVLDVIEKEDLRARVTDVGRYMMSELQKMYASCEFIGNIRGQGMFIGIDWVSDRAEKTPDPVGAALIANRLKNEGFLISNAGALGNILKIRPPLVFTREHADLFLAAFAESIHV
jgi:4-aminobutyrate aminotransferase-like enzyme